MPDRMVETRLDLRHLWGKYRITEGERKIIEGVADE